MKNIMKRKVFGVVFLLLWIGAAVITPLFKGTAEEPHYTVVLDPGHGGTDGGAVAEDGTTEKTLNLTLSLLLKGKLEERGITVIMTRDVDTDTDGFEGFHKKQDLANRAELGNHSNADAYISIHINASTNRLDQGFQVWYGSGNPDGSRLATELTEAVTAANICTRIRTVRQVPETLYIFRTVTIPSVLIECGFISNAADLYKLKQESFREALCTALCDGICNYLSGSNSDIT